MGWNDWVRKVEVEPSLYAADFSRLGDQIETLLHAGARIFHFDIGDAHFVEPVTIGPIVLASIARLIHRSGGVVDCHLMVDDPAHHFAALQAAGGDSVTFHIEAADDPVELAGRARAHGFQVGLAFTPETEVDAVVLAAHAFDLVLCIEVLEHIADAEKACSEIARVMKNRGALILSLPFRRWFPAYFRLMGHFRHYTRSDVEELLRRHGLAVIQHLPNFPRWSRFANYVYVLCRMYALLLRLFGMRRSPAEVRLPFARRAVMDILFSGIDGIRRSERSLDYAALETSTFVVACKVRVP